MDKRIKNIIFDFGGIIVDLDKQAAVHAFEALGFEAHAYINDYVQDGVFALMETGEMSPDEFCTYVRKKGLGIRCWSGFRLVACKPSVICGRITALICSVIRMPCTGHIHAVN